MHNKYIKFRALEQYLRQLTHSRVVPASHIGGGELPAILSRSRNAFDPGCEPSLQCGARKATKIVDAK